MEQYHLSIDLGSKRPKKEEIEGGKGNLLRIMNRSWPEKNFTVIKYKREGNILTIEVEG